MSLFYGGGRGEEDAPLLSFVLFYKSFKCRFRTLATPADEEGTSLSSHIIFLQENRGEISDTSDGP